MLQFIRSAVFCYSMRFDIITIFPKIFGSYFSESILARAQKNNLIKIEAHDLRQWATDKHKTVDDKPFGGGPGMIFKIEPIFKAIMALKKVKIFFERSEAKSRSHTSPRPRKCGVGRRIKQRVILFSAKGKEFTQADAKRLAKYDQLILICGRYEGVDERVAEHLADEEISIGKFVLTGGEIPAMIVVDAVSRLLPGGLGNKESLKEESFSKISRVRLRPARGGASADAQFSNSACGGEKIGEYPQYTRPENFRGWKAPRVLLSGNHQEIKDWKDEQSKKIKHA